MKRWMMGMGALAVVWFCIGPVADAGSYRVKLRDLGFVKGQAGLEAALETRFVPGHRPFGVRFPVEVFVAGNANGDQGNLEVAFRTEGGDPARGWADLWMHDERRTRAFEFEFTPAEAETCSEEEYESAKKEHYLRLYRGRIPGGAWFRHQAGESARGGRGRARENELEQSFALFSGGRAVSENLALDRQLILGELAGEGGKTVKVEDIKGVTVKAIDWSERLPVGKVVAVDALSMALPEDQHAVFFPSVAAMLELAGELENQGVPLVQTLSVRSPLPGMVARYRAQMGLDLPDAAARLMPVKSVALTGGDPFFPLGTDVALVFGTDQPGLLYQALKKTIRVKAGASGAVEKTWQAEGIRHAGYETADRTFSSHVMRKGDVVAVSNSLVQLKRLASVGDGIPALGGGDEFRFFRNRYPLGGDESAFVFLSDATIRRWAGPATRIGASRRIRALAAMSEIGCRVVDGGDPGVEFKDLLGEVTVDGRKVSGAVYGGPDFLTPVAELDLETATEAEGAAYERWRRGYEEGWSQVFDPIALRITVGKGRRELDLTVLPLTVGSDYQEMLELAGEAELDQGSRVVPPGSVLHLAMAVDRKSRMFEQFDQQLPGMLPGMKVNPLGWMGGSVSLSLEGGFFWKALAEVGMDFDTLPYFPVVLRVESASRLKLAAFLTGVWASVEQSSPDLVERSVKKHGGKSYVVVNAEDEELRICYAALPGALLVALDEELLKRAMDRELGEPEPGRLVPANEARQVLAEVRTDFLAGAGRFFNSGSLDDLRREQSWRALPVLNEWKSRFPEEDPVAVHRDLFGAILRCPGGRGYRWNQGALTMESAAYGYPAEPRDEGGKISLLHQYGSLRAGLEFSEGGLRARLSAGPARPDGGWNEDRPGNGSVLATAAELVRVKEGVVMLYKGSGPDGPESMSSRVTGVVADGQTFRIESKVDYKAGEEVFVSEYVNRLDGEGCVLTRSADAESVTEYEVPEMELPGELIEGLRLTRAFSGTNVSRDGETEDEKEFGELTMEVTGLETVKVPAGVYEDCVRVEAVRRGVNGDFYSQERSVGWYAKGVGVVKWEMSDSYGSTVMELAEVLEP